MIRNRSIYSLDGDQVVCRKPPVKRSASLKNLALLLASLPVSYISDLDARISVYADRRQWILSGEEITKIRKEILNIQERKLTEYLNKVFRSRDPFISRGDESSFSVYDKRHADVSFPEIYEASVSIAGNGRSGFTPVSIGGKDLLIWSADAYGPSFLKRFWKASRIWKAALMLLRLGIQTPEPVALVYRKAGSLRWRCSVFFKPVQGKILREILTSGSLSDAGTERLAQTLADACAVLNDMGIAITRLMADEILSSEKGIVFLGLDALKKNRETCRKHTPGTLHAFLSRELPNQDMRELFREHFSKRDLL
jgi:hypothetical protein